MHLSPQPTIKDVDHLRLSLPVDQGAAPIGLPYLLFFYNKF